MKSVPVGVFKAEFSEIIQQIREHGESFIIEYGKNHKKVAMLIPYQAHLVDQKPRQFGRLEHCGSCTLQKDFDMTDDEFLGHE